MNDQILGTNKGKKTLKLISFKQGYISIAHSGLTECELQDILSLDDHLLKHLITNDMIQLNANFLRMPCCLTTRILNAIANHLLVKPFYGMNTFCWRHKIFADAVYRRYLRKCRRNYICVKFLKLIFDIFLKTIMKNWSTIFTRT